MPVCAPVFPRITALALLPSTPLVLALLIVAMETTPFCTLIWPVKVFVPERVTVPDVVLVSVAPKPASRALIVPLSTANDVPVRMLPEPAMLPLLSVTAPTVLSKVDRSSVPPLTSTVEPPPSASVAPTLSVPAVTVV